MAFNSRRALDFVKTIRSRMYGLSGVDEASTSLQDQAEDQEEIVALTPLFYPVCFAFGAAFYMNMEAEPSWWCLLLWTVLAAGLLALVRDGGLRSVCVGMLCLVLGCGTGKLRVDMIESPRLYEATPSPVILKGVVVRVEPGERALRLRIRVNMVEGLMQGETPRYVRLTHRSDLQVEPGKAVRCRAILLPPTRFVIPGDYDFARQAWFEQLGAVGFALGACKQTGIQVSAGFFERLEDQLSAMRRALAIHVHAGAGESAGGMAAAMVAGDRSYISREDTRALRQAGLGHLLAISGLHMGLVAGLFYFLARRTWPFLEPLALRFPSPKIAALSALVVASLYLLVSGAAVSTQRAYVMVLAGMGAILCDRAAISLRSLALAMWVVTALRPDSVVTPGYQMSFSASAALIILYENWPRRGETGKSSGRLGVWILSLLASSVVASLATMPFSAYHFGRISLFSIPANIAAMPIISLLTVPAASLAVLLAPFGLSEPGFALMGRTLEWVLAIAHFVEDQTPDGQLPVMPDAVLVGFVVALVLLSSGRYRIRAGMLAGLAALGWLLAPQPVAHISSKGSVYLRTDSGWVWWRPDDRRSPGLSPLRLGKKLQRHPCREPPCLIETRAGLFVLEQDGSVRLQVRGSRKTFVLEQAESVRRGGASLMQGLVRSKLVYSFRETPPEPLRPWSMIR